MTPEQQQAWLLEQYRRETMTESERKAEASRLRMRDKSRERRKKPGVLKAEAERRAELRRLDPEKYRAADKLKRERAKAKETEEQKAARNAKRRRKRQHAKLMNTEAHQREAGKVAERNRRYYRKKKEAGYYDSDEYKARHKVQRQRYYIKRIALMSDEEKHAMHAEGYARIKARIEALPPEEQEAIKQKEKARKKAYRERKKLKKK